MKKLIISFPIALLLLTLLVSGFVLPGLRALPVVDRDEARFVQATRQMVESGNYVDIRFQDEVRYKKPVGIYWLQSLSVKTFGQLDQIWVYRIPSLIGALLAVWLTYLIGRSLFTDARIAFFAAFLFAASPALLFQGLFARADGVLVASIVGMQALLARAYLGHALSRRAAYAFWVLLAASVLLKGPLGLMISGLTLCTLCLSERRLGWVRALRPALGIPLAILLILPWFAAIHYVSGGTFWSRSVGEDFLSKVLSAQESHGAPPGYFILTTLVSFPPLCLLLWPATAFAWRERLRPELRFLLAWLVPSWLVFELVPTKLPHYVLPLLPALILAAAAAVIETPLSDRLKRALNIFCRLSLFAAALLLLALLGLSLYLAGTVSWLALLHTAAILVLVWGASQLAAPRPLAALTGHGLACGLFFVLLTADLLPTWEPIWLTQQTQNMLTSLKTRQALPSDARVAFAGYAEPSAVFIIGTETQLLGRDEAFARLKAEQADVAIVAFHRGEAPIEDPELLLLDEVSGLNYSKMQALTLRAYKVAR